jgi:hypothetical protein
MVGFDNYSSKFIGEKKRKGTLKPSQKIKMSICQLGKKCGYLEEGVYNQLDILRHIEHHLEIMLETRNFIISKGDKFKREVEEREKKNDKKRRDIKQLKNKEHEISVLRMKQHKNNEKQLKLSTVKIF